MAAPFFFLFVPEKGVKTVVPGIIYHTKFYHISPENSRVFWLSSQYFL